jgi:hypothetical protein
MMIITLIIIIGFALFLIKPWKLGRKELYSVYGVDRHTFEKWVDHFVPFKVERKGLKLLNGVAVLVIIFFLGNPKEKSMTKSELRSELGISHHIMNSQVYINEIISEEAYKMKKFPPSVCDDLKRHFRKS